MSDFAGDKTEQATPRKLEEAWKQGQFARSAEIQTVFALGAGLLALVFSGRDTWRLLHATVTTVMAHLHDAPLSIGSMQLQLIKGSLVLAQCIGPVLIAVTTGALLAGSIQSRFRTASEALHADWNRLNPATGFQRLFSFRSTVTSGLALLKLAVIVGLGYGVVRNILTDPIFYSGVGLERIAGFMASASVKIVVRVLFALALIAAIDYGYQLWRTQQDLMMTKEEVKDEVRNAEGDPHIKSAQKRRRREISMRRMLADVAQADVVITNPTHLSIALRYDRRTMKAPKIIAKGSRLNALRIREVARQHQIPILENKPVARLMFKYGKVGGEIPAQLYAAVAEILAWVYRVNAYRYHKEGTLHM